MKLEDLNPRERLAVDNWLESIRSYGGDVRDVRVERAQDNELLAFADVRIPQPINFVKIDLAPPEGVDHGEGVEQGSAIGEGVEQGSAIGEGEL